MAKRRHSGMKSAHLKKAKKRGRRKGGKKSAIKA